MTASAHDDQARVLETFTQDLIDLDVADRSMATAVLNVNEFVEALSVTLTFKSSLAEVFELLNRIHRYPNVVRLVRLVVSRPLQAGVHELSVSLRVVVIVPRSKEVG